MNCIFCKIIKKEIKSKIVYEDDKCVAFEDINPQAPSHILVVPKKHISAVRDADEKEKELLGHLLIIASKIALEKGLEKGYRIVVNDGEEAGQSVFHIHFHLLGGRKMGWPPG